jgi:hypothetical protein
LHSDADTDAPTEDVKPSQGAENTELKVFLDEVGLKRSGKQFSSRKAALGVGPNSSVLWDLPHLLKCPVEQINAHFTEGIGSYQHGDQRPEAADSLMLPDSSEKRTRPLCLKSYTSPFHYSALVRPRHLVPSAT